MANQPWRWTGPLPRRSANLIVVGWITAFLLPPIGLIIGTGLCIRKELGHGLAILVVALAITALVIAEVATSSASAVG